MPKHKTDNPKPSDPRRPRRASTRELKKVVAGTIAPPRYAAEQDPLIGTGGTFQRRS